LVRSAKPEGLSPASRSIKSPSPESASVIIKAAKPGSQKGCAHDPAGRVDRCCAEQNPGRICWRDDHGSRSRVYYGRIRLLVDHRWRLLINNRGRLTRKRSPHWSGSLRSGRRSRCRLGGLLRRRHSVQKPNAGRLVVACPSLRSIVRSHILLRIRTGVCLHPPIRRGDVCPVYSLTIDDDLLWDSSLHRLRLSESRRR